MYRGPGRGGPRGDNGKWRPGRCAPRCRLGRAGRALGHGFGGVLSFRVKGNAEQTAQVINHLELISHLANVGDTKSLIIHPTSTTHAQLSEAEQRKAGVFPNLLRLSLGIEAVEDLKTDLDEALRTL